MSIEDILKVPKRYKDRNAYRGRVSEFTVLLFLILKGYIAKIEYENPYDILVHLGKEIRRIQVKTINDRDRYSVSLQKASMRSNGVKRSRYSMDEFDFLAAVDGTKIFMIPSHLLESAKFPGEMSTSISLKRQYQEYRVQ